jgi:hypothetical protein
MAEMEEKVNPLGMKSLKESMSVPIGATVGDYFKRITTYDWIFSTLFEKIVLLLMMIWSIYSLYKFGRSFF